MNHEERVKEVVSENIRKVMEDDGPPRLRSDTRVVVVAKDSTNGYVLLGGLGPFGAGRMWLKVKDWMREDADYDTAPEVQYTPKSNGT